MKKIEDFIFRLQPQSQIQSLLEELVVALLSDLSLMKVGITVYLPSLNLIQVEAGKKDTGEIVKSFRIIGRETLGEIEEGMSTLEIPDRDEILGRVCLWRNKAEKPYDFTLFVPCFEVLKFGLRKAMVEWEQKERLDKIAEMLRREEKGEKEKREEEEAIKRLESQVVKREEDLRERDREFLSLFNLSKDGLFIIDSEGCYLDANKVACELLGYGKDEILRMKAFDPYPGKPGICWKVGLGVERCEIVNREGQNVMVEVSLSPFRHQGRDCFLGNMRRIDEYEEPEKKIRDLEKPLPEHGDESGKGLYLEFLDLDDLNDAAVAIDEDGIVMYFNKRAERLFGYSREGIIGKSLTRLMPERYREFHFDALKRLIDSGESRIIGEEIEVEGLTKDGVEFPIEFTISPIKKDGKQLYLSIIRDISRKKIQ